MMKKTVLARNVMCGLLAACALGASQSVWAVEYTNKTIEGNQTINDENFYINHKVIFDYLFKSSYMPV